MSLPTKTTDPMPRKQPDLSINVDLHHKARTKKKQQKREEN